MLLRVRSNVGLWRVDGLDDATATVNDILQGISLTRPHVAYVKPLSSDPACNNALHATQTLAEQSLQHGSMVYCRVDPATCVDVSVPAPATESGAAAEDKPLPKDASSSNMKRVIDKNGKIQLIHSDSGDLSSRNNGFRPGMLALRDMKMQWTLNDFIALDSQYEFKIKRQESSIAKQVSLDVDSTSDFQSYLRRFDFSRHRCGYLYGKFEEKTANEKMTDDDSNDEDDKMPRVLVAIPK